MPPKRSMKKKRLCAKKAQLSKGRREKSSPVAEPLSNDCNISHGVVTSYVLVTSQENPGTCQIMSNRVLCPQEHVDGNNYHVWNVTSSGDMIDYPNACLARKSVIGTMDVVRTPFDKTRQLELLMQLTDKWKRMMQALEHHRVDYTAQVAHWQQSNKHCFYRAIAEKKESGAKIVIGALGFTQPNGTVLYHYGGSRLGLGHHNGPAMRLAKNQLGKGRNGTHGTQLVCHVHDNHVVSYSGADRSLGKRVVANAFAVR